MTRSLLTFIFFLLCSGCVSSHGKMLNDMTHLATCVKDNDTGEMSEISRMQTIPDLPEKMISLCKKDAEEFANRKKLSNWSCYCCPVTSDGKIHCDQPLN